MQFRPVLSDTHIAWATEGAAAYAHCIWPYPLRTSAHTSTIPHASLHTRTLLYARAPARGLEAQHQRAAAEVASLRSAVREEQLRRGEELKERDRELAELRTQLRTAASRNQE